MKAVRFLQSARDDIRREKAYYRKIDPVLARRFQGAAAEQPSAMQVIEHEVRRWPLETFPHGVLYRDEGAFILILAVFHPKQEPTKWQGRART